jgi:hypothetical protein
VEQLSGGITNEILAKTVREQPGFGLREKLEDPEF